MRKISLICVVLLRIGVSTAAAQPLAAPKHWDVSATAALFEAKPGENDTLYQDNWYFQGRYAAAIGYYWTEHLKTEVEYATSGEGSIFFQDFRRLPADPSVYPIAVESFHRLEQGSVRMVWQFGENAWVHPYVSGGFVGDRERERVHIPAQFQPNPRTNQPVLVVHEFNNGPTWEYRLGVTAGAGAKFYMSRNAFFNTGFIGTWSQPAATLSAFAGFGIDF